MQTGDSCEPSTARAAVWTAGNCTDTLGQSRAETGTTSPDREDAAFILRSRGLRRVLPPPRGDVYPCVRANRGCHWGGRRSVPSPDHRCLVDDTTPVTTRIEECNGARSGNQGPAGHPARQISDSVYGPDALRPGSIARANPVAVISAPHAVSGKHASILTAAPAGTQDCPAEPPAPVRAGGAG